MAASIGSKSKQAFAEQYNKLEPQAQVMVDRPVQPMKLFSEWEGGTSPDCVPRLCTLRIVRLEVFSRLEQDVHDIAICVGMQGLRRSLRSGAVPLEQSGTADIELELDFSLQYPHFLKRRGNNLRVMLQRRKKYKRRTILGYKTLAVGLLNMTQVLQGYVPNHLDLYAKGEKASVAKIVVAYVSSQPMDYELVGRRNSVGNENSSDEEVDDDSYSSEVDDSAGELDSIQPIDRYARQQARIRRKPSKNFKQKILDMLFKKLKVTDEDLAVIPSDLYTDQHGQDAQVDLFFDDDDDSDPDELFNDAVSIASVQKPRLRPYFDQVSRHASQSTLTYEQGVRSMAGSGSMNALQKHMKENESGEDSKSQGSDIEFPKEPLIKEKREVSEGKSSTDTDTSPVKRDSTFRTSSMKDKAPIADTIISEHQGDRRKSSLSSIISVPVPAINEQIATVLTADETMPESIYLINIKEQIGKIFASRLLSKINKLICTASHNEVQSVLSAITSKFQKFCNKHTVSPPPLKIGIIGSDQYLTSVLRCYIDSFSPKPADWLCYVRFLVIPLGLNRVAAYIANYDQLYNSLFADSFWRSNFDTGTNLDSADFAEAERRILRYSQGATSTHHIPVAEALITYKDKGTDGESSQRFLPFLIDVRVGGELEADTEEVLSHAPAAPSQLEQPAAIAHGIGSKETQQGNAQNRESQQDKHPALAATLSAPSETHDLQVDYWASTTNFASGKKEERKESNKLSIKTTFRSLVVSRLPGPEFDDPAALSFVANLKARTKGMMRLMKPREKDVEAKTSVAAMVTNIVCTTKSHGQTFHATIDGCEWPGVKFFSLSPQWPTQVKQFPIGVFGHVETTC